MKRINIHEAKTQLSKFIAAALAGEEVIIQKAGEPLVILVPWAEHKKKRSGGGWKGQVKISSDFDSPLPAAIAKAFGVGQ